MAQERKIGNSDKSQTAVEWYHTQITKKSINDESHNVLELFEQAKQMEKQQIIRASEHTYNDTCKYYINGAMDNDAVIFGEGYYNETYKK